MAEPLYVLFVCNGNTCRSPMAQGILRKILPKTLKPQFRVLSAGLHAAEEGKATPAAVEVAGEDGVNLKPHRARPLEDKVLERADLVLTFSGAQRDEISRRRVPRFGVFALKEFVRERNRTLNVTIEDPAGGAKEAYMLCYQEIKGEIERILPELSRLWRIRNRR